MNATTQSGPNATWEIFSGKRAARSWGIRKETYNGAGIYWRGTYNVEGRGSFATITEAKACIDAGNAEAARQDREAAEAKIAAGGIRAVKEGEWVTLYAPEGPQRWSLRGFRQQLWDIEAKLGAEIVWASHPAAQLSTLSTLSA